MSDAFAVITLRDPDVQLDLVEADGVFASIEFRQSSRGYDPSVPVVDLEVEVWFDDPTSLRHLADRLAGLADSLEDQHGGAA